MGRGRDRMQQQPKIGAGWAAAAVRQGAKEIAQVLPAFPDSVKVVEEAGTPGNPTPREVYEGKGHDKQTQMQPEMG